jgi:H+/Cl- antiporter ClcA
VPYDGGMQGIQLVILLTGATVGAAAFATWYRHRGEEEPQPWTRALLGVVAGFVGLVLVLVPSMDLVVDDTEITLRVLLVAAVTLALLAGSIYRLTHR